MLSGTSVVSTKRGKKMPLFVFGGMRIGVFKEFM